VATFDRSDNLKDARFQGVNLRGARFVACDLNDIVMRGVEVANAEVDSPWLFEGGATFVVNGVDVMPLVDAELNGRFPGRELREARDPDGLRAAWTALEHAWGTAIERVKAMPAGTVDVAVGDEWSFAQTLRHLVFATDVWLRRAIQGIDQPYHPLGLIYETNDDFDRSVFADGTPAFADVLEARAGRVAMVRDYLTTVTPDDLEVPHTNPWAPEYSETTLACLHTILGEEWEHLRYAHRDLDVIEAAPAAG
jgi:hypothetical protein